MRAKVDRSIINRETKDIKLVYSNKNKILIRSMACQVCTNRDWSIKAWVF